MAKSYLEEYFVSLLNKHNLIEFVREFRFHPERKWRFDFAFPKHKVAVEIEGGAFTGGRHQYGAWMIKDQDKYNEATAMGWRVFKYSTRKQMEEFFNHYAILLENDHTNRQRDNSSNQVA